MERQQLAAYHEQLFRKRKRFYKQMINTFDTSRVDSCVPRFTILMTAARTYDHRSGSEIPMENDKRHWPQ